MDDNDLRLDGNAAAGALRELFAVDVTAAVGTCAACGTPAPLGSAHLYGDPMGAVFRCPTCTAVVMRVVRGRDRVLLDPSGLRCLEVEGPAGADPAKASP
jgi:hypothetical protein